MGDRSIRMEAAADFFTGKGSAWMKLGRDSAIKVIDACSARGVGVSIVEGGIWHNPGFEARLDAIWHSEFDEHPQMSAIAGNNGDAAQFVSNLPFAYDTAIVSTFGNAYDGLPHGGNRGD